MSFSKMDRNEAPTQPGVLNHRFFCAIYLFQFFLQLLEGETRDRYTKLTKLLLYLVVVVVVVVVVVSYWDKLKKRRFQVQNGSVLGVLRNERRGTLAI